MLFHSCRKAIIAVQSGAVLFASTVLLYCTLPLDPEQNPDYVVVSASLYHNTHRSGDSLHVYINDTVTFSLDLKLPHLVNLLSIKTAERETDSLTLFYATTDPLSDTSFSLCYSHPCTLCIAIDALLSNTKHLTDTLHLFINEKPDSNTAPRLSLSLARSYAAPSLPCTVFVATTDNETWQKVRTTLVKMPEGALFVGDSLFVWKPQVSEAGAFDTLVFIASDNSFSVKSDTDTVIVYVIADDSPPETAEGINIVQRKNKDVTFVWERVTSADYYLIFRNDTLLSDSGWQRIDSTADTSYTDKTEQVFCYRVISVNVFDWSKPSAIVTGIDTLFHGISFADSISTVLETDSMKSIEVRLSARLSDTLVVPYAILANGSTADSLDFRPLDSTRSLVFAPGDTTAFINLMMLDDTIPEHGETITLYLHDPSTALPVCNGIHQCTILPDRDSLRQRITISIEKFVCDMADDEGTDNVVDISTLHVNVTAIEQTSDSSFKHTIVENRYLIKHNGAEIGMNTGTEWIPPEGTDSSIIVILDTDRFDPPKASIVFNGYAVDADGSLNADDEGRGNLSLTYDKFFGSQDFTITSVYAGNFTIRVKLKIELK